MRKLSRLVTRDKARDDANDSAPRADPPGRRSNGGGAGTGLAAWVDPAFLRPRRKGGDSEALNVLIDAVKDYQLGCGSLIKLVRTEEEATILARPIGAALQPLRWPRRAFETAKGLQKLYNELYAAVAADPAWLKEALAPLLVAPTSFAAILWAIHEAVAREGYAQELSLGIFRSDYMLHVERRRPDHGPSLKQVEFNTFSCAGIAHSARVSAMHRHLCRSGAYDELADEITLPQLPANDSVAQVIDALALAHAEYCRQRSIPPAQAAVLMVVQPFNVNVADERPFENGLWDRDIPAHHIIWGADTLRHTSVTPTRELLFHAPGRHAAIEVAVVYHRAGYDEEEYATPVDIECRVRLERSRAIKCPSVLAHLAGFKMVQQVLAEPGALLRFLSPDKAARIVDSFAPLYPLDAASSRGRRGRELAQDADAAADHVLKPSLEGGGHNIYGREIPPFLAALAPDQWDTLILMERIHPPESTQVMIGPRGLHSGPVESELGVVGTCLWRNHPAGDQSPEGGMPLNKQAGFTLKTKAKGIDEMSVIKGYGCFDSPWLVAG